MCAQWQQISLRICAGWSVFAVRLKTSWILGHPQSALRRLISLCTKTDIHRVSCEDSDQHFLYGIRMHMHWGITEIGCQILYLSVTKYRNSPMCTRPYIFNHNTVLWIEIHWGDIRLRWRELEILRTRRGVNGLNWIYSFLASNLEKKKKKKKKKNVVQPSVHFPVIMNQIWNQILCCLAEICFLLEQG